MPPILKTMEKDPNSTASFAIASSWLRNCLENHDSCKPPAEFQKSPKRLIDVGNETRDPFLVDISPGSRQIKWLSLSYCWGEKQEVKLTKDTMCRLRSGIPLKELDRTIQDAIVVTRALGISYIWIDSLCINQDPDENEWNEQASKMHEIYGGSTATLIVTSAKSVMDGFLKEREVQYIPISSSSMPPGESTDTKAHAQVFFSPEWDSNKDDPKEPWSSRGWTMQEGLLPSRLLYFTSSQMMWKCCEEKRFERGVTKNLQDAMTTTESENNSDDLSFGSGWLWKLDTFTKFKRLPSYLPYSPDYPLLSDPEAFRLWYDLIEEYTPRRFKYISDRLVAFSGLAKIFGKTIRCDDHEYVAGLWKPDLIRGLIWHTKDAKLIPRQGPDSMRAVNNDFPSWSWASVGYEVVEYSQKESKEGLFKELSRVEDVQIGLDIEHDPFSRVKSGRVTLTGPLKRVPRLYNKEWKCADVSMSELERHLSEIVETESLGGVEHKYSSPPGGHFAVLKMLGDNPLDLLVLEVTGKVSNGINMYRRVGVLTLCGSLDFQRAVASPAAMAILYALMAQPPLTARLGPQRKEGRRIEASIKVIAELEREGWKEETVTII